VSEDITKQKVLTAFVEQIGKVPAILLSTKEGVGLVAILVGTALKAAGVEVKVDVFPFTLDLAGFKLSEDFGKVGIGDLLIGAGTLAMSAEFVKGIGEIVPL